MGSDESLDKLNQMIMKEVEQTEDAIKDMMRHYGIKRTEIKSRIKMKQSGGRFDGVPSGGVEDEKSDFFIENEKVMTIRRIWKPSEKGYGIIVKQIVEKYWEE